MYCTKCGQPVKEGLQFCTNCGNKLFSQNSCYEVEDEHDETVPVYDTERKSVSGRTPYTTAIAMVVGVIAILIVTIIMFVTDKPKNDTSDLDIQELLQNDLFKDTGTDDSYKNDNSLIQVQPQTERQTEKQTEKQTETAKYMSEEEKQLTKTMYALMDDNLYCVLEMYYFGNHLMTTGTSVGYNLEKVSSGKFSSYAAYEQFIYSVYEKDYGFKNFINPCKYMQGDSGQLGFNIAFVEDGRFYDNGSYYVDWTGYELIIDSYSSNKCYFTVKATEKSPGYSACDYVRSGTAIYKNGKWLLEKAVY